MKRYPAYKDSGVEWYGNIPAGWEVKRIKHILKREKGAIKTGPFGSQLKGEDFVESGIKVFNQRTVLDNDFNNGIHYITEEKYISLKGFEVFPKDILITSRGTIGKCAIVPENSGTGVLHPCLIRIQADFDVIYNEYLRLFIQESNYFKENVLYESNATTIEVIYSDTLKNVKMLVPPLVEQKASIKYLDHKTRLIDTLIEKKQKQIELLQEQRTAIINHAVTKGLNPNVKMKDTGIEWLGEVQEHWNAGKLKRFACVIDGDRGNEYPNENDCFETGIPFLSSKNIKNHEIEFLTTRFISKEKFDKLRQGKLVHGDIVITVRGTIGNVAQFFSNQFETAFINAQMMIMRSQSEMLPRFFFYVLISKFWQTQLDAMSYGTAQQQLSNEILSNSFISCGPLDEQKEIAIYLDDITSRIGNLISSVLKSIDWLREYRTTLISEVVTGKIDVRDEVIP